MVVINQTMLYLKYKNKEIYIRVQKNECENAFGNAIYI